MNKLSIIVFLNLLFLFCNPPYSEKLFPMELYLQGGWYKIGYSSSLSDIGPTDDTLSTIEIHFFNKHIWQQYYRESNYVKLYTWTFLATDTMIYRKNDYTSQTINIRTRGDTLIIDKIPYFYYFCRYNSLSLPSSTSVR